MDLKQKVTDLVENYDNKYTKPLVRKTIRLLKVVLLDEETDIDKITSAVPITIETMIKYAEGNDLIEALLSKEGYEVYRKKMYNILKIYQNKINYGSHLTYDNNNSQELDIMRNVIDDIYHTRHDLDFILRENCLQKKRFNEIVSDEKLLDNNFGVGTKQKVTEKLRENSLIRGKVTKQQYIIEDRFDILLAKEDVYILDPILFKKLGYASSYLFSGADVDYITKKHEVSFLAIVMSLSDPKLGQIIKEEYYTKLKKCINIEQLFLGNSLFDKKQFIIQILNFLSKNNFYKNLAITYFDLPLNLFDRIINEAIRATYVSDDIKRELINMLNIEKEGKIK